MFWKSHNFWRGNSNRLARFARAELYKKDPIFLICTWHVDEVCDGKAKIMNL